MTAANMDRSVYLTSGQVARMFGVTVQCVQAWHTKGYIESVVTLGKHRRIHVACATLLWNRQQAGMARPTPAEYAVAVVEWALGRHALQHRPLSRLEAFAARPYDGAWFLAQHNLDREARGAPPLQVDAQGYLKHADDVLAHASWVRGAHWLMAFLQDGATT
ncbi:MAG: hypothetical protein RL260_1721 [Pseudomonadota bacterium]